MRRREAISKHEAGNKSALHAITIFNCHVALVDECLLLGVTLVVRRRAAAEERDESLVDEVSKGNISLVEVTHSNIERAVEALAELARA